MFFGLGFKDKKTVKELRENQNLTAKDLADTLKLDTLDILKIDDIRLKEVGEPLRSWTEQIKICHIGRAKSVTIGPFV